MRQLSVDASVSALVVDDVDDNREVLRGLLDRAGVTVRTAHNGAEALDQIEHHRPDIVFMDVRMPVMDGLTAVRRLRERPDGRELVCVAITASGLLREPSYYIESGFNDFIGKPFRFETVCDCIERHLGVVFDRLPHEAITDAVARPAVATATRQALPEALRERLIAAARLNALTDIEAAIAEIRNLGSESAVLADALSELLARYDTDAIVALVSTESAKGA